METPKNNEESPRLSRRQLLGGMGVMLATAGISNHVIAQTLESAEKLDERALADLHEEAEQAMKLAQSAEGETEREKAERYVDYLGMGLFALGIIKLLQGNNIGPTEYGMLAGLLATKHEFSDEEGQHHITAEINDSLKALTIIAGTMVVAESTNLDFDAAIEALKNGEVSTPDKVAATMMFSSTASPITTTVGSSTALKEVTNDICAQYDNDPKLMAIMTSHVSNLSGFILFGDPPFIAVVSKYGLAEGIMWQARTMWPLWLYSLASSTYKVNLIIRQKEGHENPAKQAAADTAAGIKNNAGVVAKMAGASLVNFFKQLPGMKDQDVTGLQWAVVSQFSETVKNLFSLPFDPEFDKPHGVGGAVHSKGDQATAFLEKAFEEMPELKDISESLPTDVSTLLAQGKMDEVDGLLEKAPNAQALVEALRNFEPTFHDESYGPKNLDTKLILDRLNPLNIVNRVSFNRLQTAVGHNMADVLNVFPFQAGCVPFLMRGFNMAVEELESRGVEGKKQEAAMYFIIMFFSSFADNYVACKLGLELFPEKPEIPLAASITGGKLSAIGNMANIAQFDLETNPLGNAVRAFPVHLDEIAVNAGYALAFDVFKQIPGLGRMFTPPSLPEIQAAH